MIREYQQSDFERIREIHARQGFDYPLPDLNDRDVSRNILAHKVLETDGQVVMSLMARLTTELYLFIDPDKGTPVERWNLLKQLQRETEDDIYRKGADDEHCWVPPQMAKAFGRRMTRDLGFVRDDRYIPFCKSLEARDGQR